MIKFFASLNLAVVLTGAMLFGSGGFTAPESQQLGEVWGGALDAEVKCQDCKYTIGGCTGDSCKGGVIFGFRYWVKRTGSLMTPASCFVVAEGAPGAIECSSDTPKACYTTRICADAACTNCGDEMTVKKNSVCSVGNTLCPVTPEDKEPVEK